MTNRIAQVAAGVLHDFSRSWRRSFGRLGVRGSGWALGAGKRRVGSEDYAEAREWLPASSPFEVFTKSFNSLLGLKKGIFFGGTSTFAPVLGLRPTRPRRWRVRKLPKPRISILSPFCSASMMLSKMVSTIVSDSFWGSSVTRRPSSIRSGLVKVGCLVIVPLPLCKVREWTARSYVMRNGLEGQHRPVAPLRIIKLTRR